WGGGHGGRSRSGSGSRGPGPRSVTNRKRSMADLSDLFEMSRPFEPTDAAWRTIERRAARRQLHRRVGSAALGLGMFLGAMIGLLMAFNRTVPVFGPRG